ncbi:MAG: HD domain-containing protein [Clostridia bacterium]|nr:HD domain-containing protein [Clostridia bacterium]
MRNYIETLKPEIQEYFKILSPEGVPEFLEEYIQTQQMQQQSQVSMTCGTFYSKMFPNKFWYSSLDHSIGVALIIWNFTKDKKQTLAGLFHDIATPVFKHVVDYMNGDYETQESTEELTSQIILESKEIMNLLNRDGIKIEEVEDYHKYPIADNDTPRTFK